MSILVTGGAGFIGSHVIDSFIENNKEIISIDNYSSINSGYINKKAKYIKMDILSDEVENIFKNNNIEYCIHLAAQASVTNSIQDPANDANINILGSIKILELCKKYSCKKIIAASSAAVYGNPSKLPISEKHTTNTISPYGLSKLTMEKYIQLSGVPYVICRFSNVYGERQNAFGEAGVVSIFNEAMINNKDVFIDGNGEQSRDFIYVKDVANIIYQLCSSDITNETFNVSTNTSCTINKLFETMAKIYNYAKEPINREARIGDIRESILDNTCLTKRTQLKKFVSLNAGIQSLRNCV